MLRALSSSVLWLWMGVVVVGVLWWGIDDDMIIIPSDSTASSTWYIILVLFLFLSFLHCRYTTNSCVHLTMLMKKTINNKTQSPNPSNEDVRMNSFFELTGSWLGTHDSITTYEYRYDYEPTGRLGLGRTTSQQTSIELCDTYINNIYIYWTVRCCFYSKDSNPK